MLGIPLSNDQITNVHDAKERGIAHVIPWRHLTKHAFLKGIKTVLDDGKNRYTYPYNNILQ